jgi:hypothetical protein
MSRTKEHFLVVDVETCNSIEEPLPYDIGYCICDREGKIYLERSFMVAEIFLDLAETMKSAYYAEKIPQYWEEIKSGQRLLRTYSTIRKTILADMKEYKVKKVGAYNASFDRKALNNLSRYVTKSFNRYFFPFGTKYFCIWNMACQVIMARKTYIDFAIKNGLISNKGNLFTNAECCYRFLKKNLEFAEAHTGLEDVRIETEIMAECYRRHKKMDTSINPFCWRLVQSKRKKSA